MSGVYGVLQFNGAPVDQAVLNAMHAVYAQWFDGHHGTWLEQGVGLGHTQCLNTPESNLENQPEVDGLPDHRLVITADVRLDNRSELISALALHGPPGTITDAQLLLAAYRRWGDESPQRLLGDFAYAIWDEGNSRLFCARDHVGIRPFYYSRTKEGLVFANDIRPILSHPLVSQDINLNSVANYLLVGELTDPENTFLKSVQKLSPGSILVATPQGIRSWAYWRPEDSPTIRLPGTEAYRETLKELLQDAVHTRLRSNYGAGAHLSGGLDSSTLTALAAPILRERGSDLHTYNWIHKPEPTDDPQNPEWAAGPMVAAHCSVPHHYSELSAADILTELMEHSIVTGDATELWYERPILRAARARGTRVMLSGWGGDQFISNPGRIANTDLFWHGKVQRALKNIYEACRGTPAPTRRFLADCYRELLRPVLQTGIEFLRTPSQRSPYYRGYLDIAHPDIRALAPRRNPQYDPFPAYSLRKEQLVQFRQGFLHSRLEANAASALSQGLEYRYPLLDKRIVEFALGIPPDLYWRKGIGRNLFRCVASEALPADIAWGNLKYEPARVARLTTMDHQALEAWFRMATQNGGPLAQGWSSQLLDEEAFQSLLLRVLAQPDKTVDDELYCHGVDAAFKGIFLLKL